MVFGLWERLELVLNRALQLVGQRLDVIIDVALGFPYYQREPFDFREQSIDIFFVGSRSLQIHDDTVTRAPVEDLEMIRTTTWLISASRTSATGSYAGIGNTEVICFPHVRPVAAQFSMSSMVGLRSGDERHPHLMMTVAVGRGGQMVSEESRETSTY